MIRLVSVKGATTLPCRYLLLFFVYLTSRGLEILEYFQEFNNTANWELTHGFIKRLIL